MSTRDGVRVGAIATKILKEFTIFENLKKLHPPLKIPNTTPELRNSVPRNHSIFQKALKTLDFLRFCLRITKSFNNFKSKKV